jgi:thiol-disulfide isomerase/thioredoxin
VFAVAGFAKLADRAGSRRALIDFGVPSTLASPLGVLLALAELVLAAALLPTASAWYGALGALFLLFIFILGISINLARGRTPDCHCFGQLSSAPIGWATLARNAALAAVSVFVVWHGRDNPSLSIVSWIGDLTLAQRMLFGMGLVGLILLAAEGWVLLQMLRQQGRLLLRLDAMDTRLTSAGLAPALTEGQDVAVAGLTIGTPAPTFRLKGLRGEVFTLEALLKASKPVLLFFTNPSCGPCQVLMPDVSRWQHEYSSALTIAVVSEGTVRDNHTKSAEYGVTQVLLQQEREVADAYQAYGTPAAVLIRTDGTIGSPLAMGPDAIQKLVSRISEMAGPTPATPQNVKHRNGNGAMQVTSPVKMGQLVPPLKLQGLNGETIALTSFQGSETLLLFWNPGCGFCEQMLNDLQEWDADPPSGAPKLLVVSSGTVEDSLAMNLRSPVGLDPNSQAASAFGAGGTPMAVLLDAKGQVASEVAAGAQAVLALAGLESGERRVQRDGKEAIQRSHRRARRR